MREAREREGRVRLGEDRVDRLESDIMGLKGERER